MPIVCPMSPNSDMIATSPMFRDVCKAGAVLSPLTFSTVRK